MIVHARPCAHDSAHFAPLPVHFELTFRRPPRWIPRDRNTSHHQAWRSWGGR
jgi:hypothetical protein